MKGIQNALTCLIWIKIREMRPLLVQGFRAIFPLISDIKKHPQIQVFIDAFFCKFAWLKEIDRIVYLRFHN